ncbi:putative ammonium transporter [Triangularia verruculosa]|uniref:Ammonium transporter n=1 Tax=Triangularia verruculosa TaxID=2587418 RepID=A0AAN7AZS5_9PEZI|nr:putative ammonium transporter [Triangularia verruculosa]
MVTVTVAELPAMATTTPAIAVDYADVLRHPEKYYQGSDLAWIMISSALVFIMIPALSLIYSGLGNRSFALTLFRLPLITAAFVGLHRAGGLRDVVGRPIVVGDGPNDSAVIPELVFALYEGMFAAFTAAVVCGGTMHRTRPRRFIIFISLWSLLVYDPVARWTWSSRGWLRELGSLDFAGGTPVHVVSGTTVAAFAVFCSIESRGNFVDFLIDAGHKVWRRAQHLAYGIWSVLRIVILLVTCGHLRVPEGEDTPNEELVDQDMESFPYNINFVVLGTALLWFGWAGFNGGSALGANLRAVSAWTATHVAACAGGVTGTVWIWLMKGVPESDVELEGTDDARDEATRNRAMARQAFDRLSVFFFCDGAISGLVAITPAAGYVPLWSAPVFGVVGALCVNFLKKETEIFLRHDPLQIFAVHAGGGGVGMILTGLFVDSTTVGLDGHSTLPHPEYSTSRRVGYQFADVLSGMGYTFFVTLGILYLMKLVAFLFGKSSWSQTGVYSDSNRLEDNFQAVVQQQWRGDLDPEGRPFGRLVAPSLPPAPARPLRDDDIHLEHLKNIPSPPRSVQSGAQVPPWGMMPELPGSQGLPPWPSLPSQGLQPRM